MFAYRGTLFYSDIWRDRLCVTSGNKKKKQSCWTAFSLRGGVFTMNYPKWKWFANWEGACGCFSGMSRRREVKGGVLLTSLVVYNQNMDKL